jgi:hypothetical protein
LVFLAQTSTAKLLVLAFLFALNLLPRYPGNASWDSDYQYLQARAGRYNDWHPPIMSWLWGRLDFIVPGNGAILLFHLCLYWIGIGLIALALDRRKKHWAAWAVIGLGASPAFWTLNVQLFKDVGLAVTALAAFAILFWYRSAGRPVPKAGMAIALLLLGYATLVRANGIIATAPLFLFAVYPSILFKPLRVGLVALPMIMLGLPLSNVFNHWVMGATATYPIRSLQLFDVVGTAYYSRDASALGEKLSLKTVDECYSPVLWDTLSGKARCEIFWYELATAPSEKAIQKSAWYLDPPSDTLSHLWVASISKHPFAYLSHRLIHFNYEVGFFAPRHLSDKWVLNQFVYNGPPKPLGSSSALSRIFDALKYNPIFSPTFCLVIGLMVVVSARRRLTTEYGDNGLDNIQFIAATLALCYSGLLYSLGFFLVGVANEDRYQFWPMLAVLLSVPIFLAATPRAIVFRNNPVKLGILSAVVIILFAAQLACGDALAVSYKFNFDRVNLAKLIVSGEDSR